MNTSTPIKTPRKHKNSLLPFQDVTDSNKRRKLSNVINQSVTVQAEVDDELERSWRRFEAEHQRRLSSTGLQVDEREMRDHFQICLKMYAENKINQKNVWNLKIIDYMRIVLHSQEFCKDSLLVAGTSLDVSVKIYGIRVDDIHLLAHQIANNMARMNALRDAEIAKENDHLENDKSEERQQPRKKKRPRLCFEEKPTIAKDLKSIVGDIPKLESTFFQSKINLELSAVDNLFTNKLPMNHAKYKFMLLSKEKAWPSYNKKDTSINFSTKYHFEVSKLKDFQICAPFSDFEIDEWDVGRESMLLAEKSRINDEINEEVVYDEDGIPIPELDGSVHDLFADVEEDAECCKEIKQDLVVTKKVARIVDFKPDKNYMRPSEYCYASATRGNILITQVWAGPSHWKLKYINRFESRFTGHPQKQGKKAGKRNRVEPSLIDFNTDIPPFDKTKIYNLKKVRIDTSPHKCTLPQIRYFDRGLYRYLMLKPVCIRLDRYSDKGDSKDPENEFENVNHSLHGSGSQDHNSQTDDEGSDGHQNLAQNVVSPQENFQNRNLIDKPESVPKCFVSYALRAQRMNMKKLKAAIWKCLVSSEPNEKISNDHMYEREVHKRTFSDVYKEIPSQLSKRMRQDLSCPLAFVALLNLCNEQNLQLIEQSNLQDFSIEKCFEF